MFILVKSLALAGIFLLSTCVPTLVAETSGVLGTSDGKGGLGGLDGWAAFAITGEANYVWLAKNTGSGSAVQLVEALSEDAHLLKTILEPEKMVAAKWFEGQDDFEKAAAKACQELKSKKLLALKKEPLFPNLGKVQISESAITVIKVTVTNEKKLALESAPVSCLDPDENRLQLLLQRSTVFLVYAAGAELVNRSTKIKNDARRAALLQIAVFKQMLKVFKAREAWFKQHAAPQKKLLDQANKATRARLEKRENSFRQKFPKQEDLLLMKTVVGLETADWEQLGIK